MADDQEAGSASPTAIIIVIGNEILSGKVRDENVPFLARRLYELGVEVASVHFLPDEHEVLVSGIRHASQTATYVFTTGGLGPTHDDITVKSVAEAMGRGFVHSPSLESLLEKLYGLPPGPQRTHFATIPEGTEFIHPEGAHYPQAVVGNVYLFPGVPEVTRKKFELIADRFRAATIKSLELNLERSELEIVDVLNRVVAAFPRVKIGSYPHYHTGKETVTLTFDSRFHEEVEAAYARMRDDLGMK